MTLRDLPKIVRIANQAFLEMGRKPHRFGSAMLQRLRQMPDLQLVALKQGKAVGFLDGSIDPKGEAIVNWIAIHPSFQGEGIGRALLSEYEGRMKTKGFKKVLVGTPYARGFYESCGYTCINITYNLVKELVGVPITGCNTLEARRLELEDLPKVIDTFGEDLSRTFLESFFQTYEKEPEKALCTIRNGKIVGLIVGRTNQWSSELVEVAFFHALDSETLLCVIKDLELECSRRGVRFLGVSTEDQGIVKRLEDEGWKIESMPV